MRRFLVVFLLGRCLLCACVFVVCVWCLFFPSFSVCVAIRITLAS
jgi:hypothetical protein